MCRTADPSHFSEDGTIRIFIPRPVKVSAHRPAGQDWLNSPLVWAIAPEYRFLYLFPRDCPRILAWTTPTTRAEDAAKWLGEDKRIAYVEEGWVERIETAEIHEYRLPHKPFISLEDVGMMVSREAVTPLGVTSLTDLPEHIRHAGVTLRPVLSLAPVMEIFDSSLHASGIRLRNARPC